MKIQVTQDHIDNGTVKDACLCPIALAIRDATGAAHFDVIVSTHGWSHYNGNKLLGNYELPVDATNFITKFDLGEPVSPFEFELEED